MMSFLLIQGTKKYVMTAFCFAVILFCNSCTGAPVNLKGSLTYPLTVQVDDFVKRNAPEIYVYPDKSPANVPTALFIPFKVTQDMEYRKSLGKSVSRQIWQTWLSQRAFSILEFYDPGTTYNPEMAIAYGKRKGADLVVGGYITHYLDSGVSGDSYASISIEIYEVSTGNLIWSMAQAGSMEKQAAIDFYVFRVEKRLPSNPINYIVTMLASDMGNEILKWTKPYETGKDPLLSDEVF